MPKLAVLNLLTKLKLNKMNIIEQANKQAFDTDKYRLNLWLMYLSADSCQSAAVDIESQLKKIGAYQFEDKQTVKAIKHHSSKMIGDVDKCCQRDFACEFGDIADEVRVMVTSYLKNRLKTIEIK